MKWKVEKWYKFKGDLKMCESGYHLTTNPSEWFKAFCDIYKAETKDKNPEFNGDKCVVRTAKITTKLSKEERSKFDKNNVEKEIAKLPTPIQTKLQDFISKDIQRVRFFKPDGKPKKEWKIFYGDTWDAARDAAWDAARDAALVSSIIITSDLEFKDCEKHRKYAQARWEVWKKGYGVVFDVNGVLYVYCKGKPPKV